MNCRLLLALFAQSLAPLAQDSADTSNLPARPAPGQPWNVKKAWDWFRASGPIRGCNYLPRTAVNSTEMWQAETFDPKTIGQELGWAEALGYNSVRVFLQFVVWQQDPKGFKQRLNRFLGIAGLHHIRAMLILFDDCAFAGREPYLGRQDEPVPGVHNSGWVPSPGLRRVTDRAAWPELEMYVKDVVGSFANDKRVLIWDLYNEPGNSNLGDKSLPLVEATFAWARAAQPSQPLTMGPWADFESLLSRRLFELSDVISFHGYDAPEGIRKKIKLCRSLGRPVICTEWLRRQVGNTFAAILPIFSEQNVGWYHWGLVAGRTQTYLPWESRRGDPPPKVWQHDVLRPDGSPYDSQEADLLRTQRPKPGR